MTIERRDPDLVTPEYEDAGLFRNRICHVNVALVPIVQRTRRNDLLVTGFVKEHTRIAVLFAGRRTVEAASLLALLNTLKSYAVDCAKDRGAAPPDNEKIRIPVKIEGAWRPQFFRDHNGWETKAYQLVASRWIVSNTKGTTASFGQVPLIRRQSA